MKAISLLMFLLAVAVLLLGGLIRSGSRPFQARDAEPSPLAPSGRAAAPQAVTERLSGLAAPEVAPHSRSTASSPSRPREIESALPPLADLASHVTPASIEEGFPSEPELFAKKYASSNAQDRRLAREALIKILAAHRAGTEDEAQALTDDQAASIGHEIDWLSENLSP